jgi:hypothetical protein
MAAELIPAVRQRLGAGPPAWAAAALRVVRHLISSLGDDVTPPSQPVVEPEAWKRYALQAISQSGADLSEMSARSYQPRAKGGN